MKHGIGAELLASNNPESDPNSGHLGYFIDLYPAKEDGTSHPFLEAMKITVSPRIESDRYFQNTNAMLELKAGWTPLKFPGSKYFHIRPAIGVELGRNIDSPVVEAKGLALSRGVARLLVFKTFKPKAAENDRYKLSAEYIQRFLLKPEVFFKEEEDSKLLVPVRYAATPRGYFDAKFETSFSKHFGVAYKTSLANCHQSTSIWIIASLWG